MPMSEACALWVDQAVQEAVESGEDVVKSFSALSREIQEEIQKRFETRVSVETLRKKLAKAAGKVDQPTPTAGDGCGKVVTGGDKLPPEKIVEKVDALVEKGLSTREAAKEVARATGKRPDAVRQTYFREKERQEAGSAGFAVNRAILHRVVPPP